MTTEEIMSTTAVNTWKLIIDRFSKGIAPLTDEQLQQQVAPGRNRLLYLVGHLTAVHDRMFSLLDLGERLHPDSTTSTSPTPTKRIPTHSPLQTSSRPGTKSTPGSPRPSKSSHRRSGCKNTPPSPTKTSPKTPRATASPSSSAAPATLPSTPDKQSSSDPRRKEPVVPHRIRLLVI